MKRIFLSYSRKDLEFAEKLARDLQRAGYDVWYDLSDLEGGDRWAREIQDGIDQCDAFITVISPNSMASDWVEKEFLYASSAGKNMIPLMYERTKLPIWLMRIPLARTQATFTWRAAAPGPIRKTAFARSRAFL